MQSRAQADLLDAAGAAALSGPPAEALAPLDRLLDPTSGASLWTRSRARWLEGVALGALGRYEAALAALEPLLPTADDAAQRAPDRAAVAVAAAAAYASLLRQIGDHPAAEPLDRRALALAEAVLTEAVLTDAVLAERVPVEAGPAFARAALLDALVGSTADAVGLGDLDEARRRLAAAEAAFGALASPPWRPTIRLRWVETEVALLAGDFERALSAAAAAVAQAEAQGSPRHLAKSAMFLGVASALLASGRGEPVTAARITLHNAVQLAERHALRPLLWPLRAVLAGMPGLAVDDEQARRHRRLARAVVRSIADELSPERAATWRARDPMAAVLLDPGPDR